MKSKKGCKLKVKGCKYGHRNKPPIFSNSVASKGLGFDCLSSHSTAYFFRNLKTCAFIIYVILNAFR